MTRLNSLLPLFLLALLVGPRSGYAQSAPLTDRNNDGQVEVIAFGDSLTYGVGDGLEPGQYVGGLGEVGAPRGYPLRLSSLLSIPVMNAGIPGEMVIGIPGPRASGVVRFPEVVAGSSADLVIIFEGANDTWFDIPATQMEAGFQKMINVARADNKNVAITTLLPPTLQHGMFAVQSALYSETIRYVASLNDIALIDLEQGFLRDCPDLSTCAYYNLPEGLHPNTLGYDAITSMVAEALQR